jgi:hypothetical protein
VRFVSVAPMIIADGGMQNQLHTVRGVFLPKLWKGPIQTYKETTPHPLNLDHGRCITGSKGSHIVYRAAPLVIAGYVLSPAIEHVQTVGR